MKNISESVCPFEESIDQRAQAYRALDCGISVAMQKVFDIAFVPKKLKRGIGPFSIPMRSGFDEALLICCLSSGTGLSLLEHDGTASLLPREHPIGNGERKRR